MRRFARIMNGIYQALEEIYDAQFVPKYRTLDEAFMAWIESHQTLDRHPKVADLRNEMGWDVDTAIGKLHRFWWWCVDYAPDGDLRKHNDTRIGDAVGIYGPHATKFVQAMVKSGWIDREPYFRVHDWYSYFGRFLKLKYKDKPEIWKAIETAYAEHACNTSVTDAVTPPVTIPVTPLTIPNLTKPTEPKPPVVNFDSEVEQLYEAYPRKKSPGQAKKAIRAALKKATFAELLAGVKRYANERKGQDPTYTKYPASWFNGECWLEQPDAPKAALSAIERAEQLHKQGQKFGA